VDVCGTPATSAVLSTSADMLLAFSATSSVEREKERVVEGAVVSSLWLN
jgi:hypothetical protein